jgi:acetate kinase
MPGGRASDLVLVLNAGSSSLKFKVFSETFKGVLPPVYLLSYPGSRDAVLRSRSSCSPELGLKILTRVHAGLNAVVGGLVERIGDMKNSRVIATNLGGPEPSKSVFSTAIADHTAALDFVLQYLQESYSSQVVQDVKAIGHRCAWPWILASYVLAMLPWHACTSTDRITEGSQPPFLPRVVHGKDISEPVAISAEVLDTIQAAIPLAPLHNPANLEGIRAATRVFPSSHQVR